MLEAAHLGARQGLPHLQAGWASCTCMQQTCRQSLSLPSHATGRQVPLMPAAGLCAVHRSVHAGLPSVGLMLLPQAAHCSVVRWSFSQLAGPAHVCCRPVCSAQAHPLRSRPVWKTVPRTCPAHRQVSYFAQPSAVQATHQRCLLP